MQAIKTEMIRPYKIRAAGITLLLIALLGCGSSTSSMTQPPSSPTPTTPSTPSAPPTPPSDTGKLFAPYVDMGLPSDANLVQIQKTAGFTAVTLAFLISTGGCQAGWEGVGGTFPTDTLSNGATMLSVVQGLQAAGVQVIISFGGAAGSEPALTCSSATQLQALYQSVLNRYKVTMLDFDIEGNAVNDAASLTLRDQALVGLKTANPGLVISYTLPVMPTGLQTYWGLNVLTTAKADGLSVDVVNIMTMDYGSADDNGAQMGLDATDAATATSAQIANLGLSASLGIIPMLGVNDVSTEVFQIADAQTLLTYANANANVHRIAMWSVARDNGSCSGNTVASASCSGITQTAYQFSSIFHTF